MTLRLLINLQCRETMSVMWYRAKKEEHDRDWHSSQNNRHAMHSSQVLEVRERLDPQLYYGIWWSPVSLRSTRRGLCPTGWDAPHCSLASYTCSHNMRFLSNHVTSFFIASLSPLGPLGISFIIRILLEIPSHFDKWRLAYFFCSIIFLCGTCLLCDYKHFSLLWVKSESNYSL